MAITVTGGAEIALVAAAVRKLGTDRQIVNDMAKEIKRAIPPIRTAVRVHTLIILPHRGGLAAEVATTRVTGAVRRGANTAGLTIRGGKNSKGGRTDLKRMDAGRIRHKTWGHLPWSAQTVRPGFFTDAVTDEGRKRLEDAVITAADNAAARVLYG